MARPKGLEPLTPALEGRCSIQLSYERTWSGWQDLNPRPSGPKPDALPNCATPRYLNGGEGGIRTHVGLHPNGFQDRPVVTASVPLQFGDLSAIRTRDTLIKSQVLCQLS